MRNPAPLIIAALLCCKLSSALAGTGTGSLTIEILDRSGAPLPEVVAYVVPAHPVPRPAGVAAATATMDQRDLAFVPHILVVQTGTLIDFPNSDAVRHHVYSFSPAKRFELALYQGSVHAPLRFDEPGVVTLGCNIHDQMLGYIRVVDTPYFAKTGGNGRVVLDELPADGYRLELWTPRLRPDRQPEPVMLTVAPGGTDTVTVQIRDKLYPPHAQSETSLTWSNY